MNITFRNDKIDVPDVSEAEAKTICHLLSEGRGDEALAVFEDAAKRAMNPKMVAELQRIRKKYEFEDAAKRAMNSKMVAELQRIRKKYE